MVNYHEIAGRLKAVLFDMDGVLFDSMPNHAYAWRHAMKEYGLAITQEEVYMNEGRTGSATINMLAQRFWGRDATEEEKLLIYEAKSKIFNTCHEAKPRPGALETLQAVKAKGLIIVLVTGSAQTSLLEKLEYNYPGFFHQDLMVTGFDVKLGKPYPEPYLKGLQKAGIMPEEGIVVENAPLGVEAGRAAGIFTIAANTGPLPDEILKNAGADIVLPGMMDVANFFSD